MNYIDKKTNKKKVINFALTLGRSWRAKNAPKFSSKYLKNRIYKIVFELNTDDNKSKYYSNLKDILKSAKKL